MTGMRARLKEFQREASLIPGFSGRVADGIVGLFGLFTSQAQGPGRGPTGDTRPRGCENRHPPRLARRVFGIVSDGRPGFFKGLICTPASVVPPVSALL